MDEYIRQLRVYVQEHKIIFEEECPQPCLDVLWWHYGEYHNMDSPQAKEGLKISGPAWTRYWLRIAMWYLKM